MTRRRILAQALSTASAIAGLAFLAGCDDSTSTGKTSVIPKERANEIDKQNEASAKAAAEASKKGN